MKYYKSFQKKYKEVYKDIKDKWEEFEKQYWKKYPDEKYCHICGEKKKIELHHIIPRHIAPERIFDENNLIPLCHSCHFRWGHLNNWLLYNPKIVIDAENLYKIHQLRLDAAKNNPTS